MRIRTPVAYAIVGVLVLALAPAAASAAVVSHSSSDALSFNANSQVTKQAPAGSNEPSGIAGSDGQLYVASQNPNAAPGTPDTTLSTSTDGVNWQQDTAYGTYLAGRAEGQTGDVTMAADRAGTVFIGHLTGALQADIDYTRDGGKSWQTANDVAQLPSPGAASSSPFAVDRPWIAVYSPDTNYKDTRVFLEFHDFGPSAVYIVSCSMASGSLQCGAPVPVSNPQTACNSIPGGVAVSPAGSAHPGRVYAVWTTADPQTNVSSGCNYTQLAPFYSLYVAWSDTPADSSSWHQVPVYIGPHGGNENCPGTSPVEGVSTNTCADMSELFTPVAVDAAGNAYVAFVDYADTIDKHYDMYLSRSLDGGNTWNGASDGSGQPLIVGDAAGTHYTPQIFAGSPGHVALSYFDTGYSATPYTSGATCPTTAPPETSCQGKNQPQPPSTQWVFDVAESTNANARTPTFSQVQASDPGAVVHYGDMCNLGIYCDGSSTGNRSMFENTTVFPDASGGLVAAWTDQRLDPKGEQDAGQSDAQSRQVAYDEVFATSQSSGPRLIVAPASSPPGTPPTPGMPPARQRSHGGPRCARPSGGLTPARLGPITLGMTRPQARRSFRHFSTRRRRDMDFYCLTPGGIRAGFAPPRLLRSASARVRRQIRNRAVLVLTATSFYALRGVRAGATLRAAHRVLKLGRPFHVGLNYWYIAPFGAGRAVLKVRHGMVEEIGIGNRQLTRNRRVAGLFFVSFR